MAEDSKGVGRHVGGLWCNQVLERLPDVVEGTLHASEMARVTEHVRGCTECERFGGRYGALVRTLRGIPAETDVAGVEDILLRVMDARG